MKNTIIYALMLCILSMCSFVVYPYPKDPNFEEHLVELACIQQKILDTVPTSKLLMCKGVPKQNLISCVGLAKETISSFQNSCSIQLNNFKCIATKLNIYLIGVAACEVDRNSSLCYQKINVNPAAVAKARNECQSVQPNPVAPNYDYKKLIH